MKSASGTTLIDPESVCAILTAVRCAASLTGDFSVSLRISLLAEECVRCRGVSQTFIEPAHVCTACWSILALNAAVDGLEILS
jgi:hypothetical protein